MQDQLIENVSFIVIAKDEEFALSKCLESLASAPTRNCEYFFVDSDSKDNSLKLMNGFDNNDSSEPVSVFQIQGDINSAIARNVGIERASKEILFLIDGDTEINPSFLQMALKRMRDDKSLVGIVGKLAEQFYDNSYSSKIRFLDDRFNINKEKQIFHAGGNIICRRSIIELSGIQNPIFKRSQDLDFSLRLSRYGKILALPHRLGTHHTLEYRKRSLSFGFKGYGKYLGYLTRANITYFNGLKSTVNGQSGHFIGVFLYIYSIFVLILAIFNGFVFASKAFIPILMFLVLDILNGLLKSKNIGLRLVNRLVDPLFVFFGFVTYTTKFKNKWTCNKTR